MFLAKADIDDELRPPPAPADVAAAVGAAEVAQRYPGGTRHAVYRVPLRNGRMVVVRVLLARDRQGAATLVTGAMAAGLAAAAGVATAVPEAVELGCARLRYPFEVLPELAGRPVRELEDPESQALPPATFHAIGASLALLHGVRGTGAGPLIADRGRLRGRYGRWEEHVRCRLNEHVEACAALGAIDPGERAAILGLFHYRDDLLRCDEPRLLHGDPSHANALLTPAEQVAWIDWEDACFGDPVFDLANWATFCREEALTPMLAGYTASSPLPPDFGDRFWLLYLRVALAKTVVRSRLGLADRPGRPAASLRIQRALERLTPSRAA
jgi:aminoglycoside phosphotransferase (APT) family kinase protein